MSYVGYAKLRPGRIHLFCPKCERKMSNMPREPHDPKSAVLVHAVCCASGSKDGPAVYLNARGQQVRCP